ncbi:hypothetical protein ACFSUD_04460 [Sulfitobacter aestuarii]|uniref:Uncharacterized protein n=1 Tax=Sulfitobacter aestuarii TaxID=2161676 RepID=A0ABW5U182_9RHOB
MLRLWPTPRASANENRQTKPSPSQEAGKQGMNPATSAAMWPTPQTDSFRSQGGARKNEKGFDGMARDWPTPMATDGNKPSAGNRKSADLTSACQMWMTPTARDHKDGATTLTNTPVKVTPRLDRDGAHIGEMDKSPVFRRFLPCERSPGARNPIFSPPSH